jgi:hypothetical protein
MSTTEAEIKIDLDAIDAEKAKKDTKGAKTDTVDPNTETIEVKKIDSDVKTETREVLTPDAGVEKLKKQLEDERIARAAAERQAQASSEAELRARSETQTTQLDLVTNAIATVKQSQKSLRTDYATAMSAQDFERVAEIQEAMGDNSARLLQLENGKSALEKAPKPAPRSVADPVEQFASRLTPTSAAWVRAHPDYVRDPAKNRQMLAAHEIAVARGYAADTPGYFSSIEKTLDIAGDLPGNGSGTHIEVEPADDPMKDAARAALVRKAPPAAAPVTRSGNGAGNRRNVVTLTPAEVEIAQMMQMTPEEYARNKVALIKDGKLN